MQVEVPDVSSEESDQEATKERIWESLKQKGKLRVADSGLEKGDVAIIDFVARRAETGETIAGSEKRGMQVDTMDEDAVFGIEGTPLTALVCRCRMNLPLHRCVCIIAWPHSRENRETGSCCIFGASSTVSFYGLASLLSQEQSQLDRV